MPKECFTLGTARGSLKISKKQNINADGAEVWEMAELMLKIINSLLLGGFNDWSTCSEFSL